jgi:hypothetical protein
MQPPTPVEPNQTSVRPADPLLRVTLPLMVATDLGLILYWTLIATSLLPASYQFAEYTDPRVIAWNWSFLPLDLVASLTGLAAAHAVRTRAAAAGHQLVVSLALTATAGGFAVAYWALRSQFDPSWWLPNLFLLLFPLPLLIRVLRTGQINRSASPEPPRIV